MNALLPGYAELHCLSNFSFLRGASHPEELVQQAHAQGYAALALTDECSMAGVVRAHLAAKEVGLKLIVGTEVSLAAGPKLVLLAQNRDGYGRLCTLITRARRRAAKGRYELKMADLEAGLPDCLALLIPCNDVSDNAAARWLAHCFPDRAWIAAELLRGPDDRARLAALQALSRHSGMPLVAAGDVHMHVRSRQPLQDTLTAIRLGNPVHDCGHALFSNAERHLRSRVELARIYPRELLDETLRIASLCSFSLEELRYEYPEEIVPPGETAASYLRKEVEKGLVRRYGERIPDPVRQQIEHELALIEEKRYEPYFLTVYDVVNFAREQGILCQGRGSAANSAVCYALGITEVDPARSSLLFERFISRERNEPPDIDVDFEHERREEVIQYIYGKYGRDRAALAATVIRYRPRSAVRDVAKALGFEAEQIERLARKLAWWDSHGALLERAREAGFDPASPRTLQLLQLVQQLVGFPRHLSQHVGGFVIARGLLCELVPIENAAMQDRCVIQWEKDDLEALGLMKVDVLALGMLTALRKTLDLLNAFHGWRLRLQDIPDGDEATFRMIQAADTVGVFQIESRAQMSMLPRMKPANFYDLVVEVALVRPGPIQGGMVHPYLAQRERQRAGEPITYPSEELRPVLERTLGVPIFQEQVMQLAMVAAGFSADRADKLRRSMASWHSKGSLDQFEQELLEGMLKKGYSLEFARRIWKQIEGFGEYGFPESHSASFALLAYDSAWLKCHHPAAFLAGLLNSQPMGFYSPSQLVQDARRHGVEVRPVDVCRSDWDCALEPDVRGQPAVRLGLRMVKGLAQSSAIRIVEARHAAPFADVGDLSRRAELTQADLQSLAHAGALSSLAGHRRQAYWETAGVQTRKHLLRDAPVAEPAIELPAPEEAEEILADYASLGLTLGRHPLALLRPKLQRLGSIEAREVAAHAGRLVRVSGLVTCRQRPGTASGVIFVTLEDETGTANVVVWARLAERQRKELLDARLLTVHGLVERNGEVVHLIARRLLDHSALLGPLQTRSRDFT